MGNENRTETQGGSGAPHLKLKEYIDLFNIYRSYAMQESNLINNRLTWILAIHGFLYATYGFTLQKELEVVRSIHENYKPIVSIANFVNPVCYVLSQAQIFLGSIALVGAAISLLGLRSIRAAQKSSHSVNYIFMNPKNTAHHIETMDSLNLHDPKAHVVLKTADGYYLPNLRGGGQHSNVEFGHTASTFIPIILAVSWMLSLMALGYFDYMNNAILCWN